MTDTAWLRGTWSTMSPSRFSPPVPSDCSSQAVHPSPLQASQTRGGLFGSTPTPSIRQDSRSDTAQPGTASPRPTSSASPGTGTLLKHVKPSPRSRASRRQTGLALVPFAIVATSCREQGTMSSGSAVVKLIESSVSVRRVDTVVPSGIRTVSASVPESQNVMGARAAVGGNSRTPMSSRNLT